jgi:hypothetical protein
MQFGIFTNFHPAPDPSGVLPKSKSMANAATDVPVRRSYYGLFGDGLKARPVTAPGTLSRAESPSGYSPG